MTVIRRKQQSYDYPNANNGSDTESLHLPSETESLHSEPIMPGRTLMFKVPPFDNFGHLKKNSGKRKQRRYQNCSELQTLAEEDETAESLMKIVEDYKGPFTRLLEDQDALNYWNHFVALPEEEQLKLLKSEKCLQEGEMKSNETSNRISSKLRRAMKIKKNFPMEATQKMEDDVINYFLLDRDGVYYSKPATSFERLLLHAIAQYHNLLSKSYFGDVRNVEICTDNRMWSPKKERFCDFVEKLRQ